MAKEKTQSENVQDKPEDAITLDEFCTRLSATDRRVEMIGAFNHVEKKVGRIKNSVVTRQEI
jgi:hypothetical protein